MSVAEAPPRGGFRVSMLWRDSRYRSTFIQSIALLLLMLSFAWLIDNMLRNLEALGQTFSFSFMWQPAGYDINQTLISYTSQSSNARAAAVGILNTLLVAALGCATALVVGVVMGVLRLSKNWLVRRLTDVYVEGFRNVPVLMWILLTITVVNESFPTPRDFRDVETGALVATNRGVYVASPVATELAWAVGVVLVLSVAGAIAFRRWAKRRQEATGAILPAGWIAFAIIAVPTVCAFLLLGRPISFEYPELAGFNFRGGLYLRDSLIALWLALSLYTGAFIAEIVRAGIQSVSRGQTEAAFALGLRPNRTMRLVILPQAMRVIIPPLISQFLNLTKNSSLAVAIGYMDATGTLGGITLNQTGRAMECILLLMAFYLTTSLVISAVMNWYNKRVKLVER